MYDNWKPMGALAPETVTAREREALAYLRRGLVQHSAVHALSPWLRAVTDVELLRFVRARAGDEASAWAMCVGVRGWGWRNELSGFCY